MDDNEFFDILNYLDNFIDSNHNTYTLDKIAHLEHLEDLKDALFSKLYYYLHNGHNVTSSDIQEFKNELQSLKEEIKSLKYDNTI
jgi:aspartyl-tRNA synthetase